VTDRAAVPAAPPAPTDAAALRFAITGVGLLGPGLVDWESGHGSLADPERYLGAPTVVPPPPRLPPTERRRAGAAVKASIAVAEQAVAMAGADPASLATVFTASSGDPANCHAMCEALATPERLVSPTRFTNSVHNAAAGVWHIAVRSRAPSTSIAAHDDSFAAGVLEAASQCMATGAPVLLVACDLPYPEPLHALRPLPDVFACALLLAPPSTAAPWQVALTVDGSADAPSTPCDVPSLEVLRRAIPAAHALPLLQRLARRAAGAPAVVLAPVGGPTLTLEVHPQ
jgi:hypothetical protein